MDDSGLCWLLLYTKPHAEVWADINLRKQGLVTLLPRVRRRGGHGPLFPRYVFAGYRAGQSMEALRSTRGVLYIVHCGDRPARVSPVVIADVRGRMDASGVVALEPASAPDSLFATGERSRLRALEKLARAGFRVVA
jgi:transcription antitermination factor NusG